MVPGCVYSAGLHISAVLQTIQTTLTAMIGSVCPFGATGVIPGGCCSESYLQSRTDQADEGSWRLPFTINAIFVAATPAPAAALTPCADVHADPTHADALPAPICADVLARRACGIPAIRARCNFTCTGCTAAPVIPPIRAPTSWSLRWH